MKKKGKKLVISLGLVFCMVLSILVVPKKALAAETLTTPGASKETATRLEYLANGYYAQRGSADADWYYFTAPSSPAYTSVYFKNTGMNTRANINIYTVANEERYSSYCYNGNSRSYEAKLEANQSYYIKITKGNAGGTYLLYLTAAYDVIGNTKNEASLVGLNQEYTWTMDGTDDEDYASFTVAKSGKYKFTYKNSNIDDSLDCKIRRWTTNEQVFYSYAYSNNEKSDSIQLEAGQYYYIQFYGTGSNKGSYTFSILNQSVSAIDLSTKELMIKTGQTYQLEKTIYPINAYNTSVTWASNNAGVASVNASGLVTAQGAGETLITCTANDGNGAIGVCKVIVLPLAPNRIRVDTSVNSKEKISIVWDGVRNASGYTVYAYDSKTKNWTEVISVDTNAINPTNAIITGIPYNGILQRLKAGATYQFRVATYILVNGNKYYGDFTSILAVGIAPNRTKIKSLTLNASRKITLKWEKVSGASGYYIYRKDSKDGDYKYYATVSKGTKISYSAKVRRGKYSYKVAAYKTVDSVTSTGAFSKAKSISVK